MNNTFYLNSKNSRKKIVKKIVKNLNWVLNYARYNQIERITIIKHFPSTFEQSSLCVYFKDKVFYSMFENFYVLINWLINRKSWHTNNIELTIYSFNYVTKKYKLTENDLKTIIKQ